MTIRRADLDNLDLGERARRQVKMHREHPIYRVLPEMDWGAPEALPREFQSHSGYTYWPGDASFERLSGPTVTHYN